MDVRMPHTDGIAATRAIRESASPTRVLVLKTFDVDEYMFAAIRAGASGFLVKDATAEDLVADRSQAPKARAALRRGRPCGG